MNDTGYCNARDAKTSKCAMLNTFLWNKEWKTSKKVLKSIYLNYYVIKYLFKLLCILLNNKSKRDIEQN